MFCILSYWPINSKDQIWTGGLAHLQSSFLILLKLRLPLLIRVFKTSNPRGILLEAPFPACNSTVMLLALKCAIIFESGSFLVSISIDDPKIGCNVLLSNMLSHLTNLIMIN